MEVNKRVLEQGWKHFPPCGMPQPGDCGPVFLWSETDPETWMLPNSYEDCVVKGMCAWQRASHREGLWPLTTSGERAFYQTSMNVGSCLGLASLPLSDLVYWVLCGSFY